MIQHRPYLVIPKLIEQPTWGGTYIVETKKWQDKKELAGKKIGQSYELYDKSNLSLTTDSSDPAFMGELSDSKSVAQQTTPKGTLSLSELIQGDAEGTLGTHVVSKYGITMPLLLKFTQALGNSFQVHIKDGVHDPKWKPKPESWYYFEPGMITLGVKSGANWEQYERAVTQLDTQITAIANEVQAKTKSYESAKAEIDRLVAQYNPWQYVNRLDVPAKTLIDLSPCGIHHSWEEDAQKSPLGNVVYEIQVNVMDDAATIRNFDKGKMDVSGKIRPLQIADYFRVIDRSLEANNPETHMRKAKVLVGNDSLCLERLLESTYYTMDKIKLKKPNIEWKDTIQTYKHLFVKSGSVILTAGDTRLTVGTGHAAFVPAAVGSYTLKSLEEKTNVIISFS